MRGEPHPDRVSHENMGSALLESYWQMLNIGSEADNAHDEQPRKLLLTCSAMQGLQMKSMLQAFGGHSSAAGQQCHNHIDISTCNCSRCWQFLALLSPYTATGTGKTGVMTSSLSPSSSSASSHPNSPWVLTSVSRGGHVHLYMIEAFLTACFRLSGLPPHTRRAPRLDQCRLPHLLPRLHRTHQPPRHYRPECPAPLPPPPAPS